MAMVVGQDVEKDPQFRFSHRLKPQHTARVRLGFSLATASLDGLFEHPAGHKTPFE